MDIGSSSETINSTLPKAFQETLDKFMPNTVSEEQSSAAFTVNTDFLANKRTKLVVERIKPSRREQNLASMVASVSNLLRHDIQATKSSGIFHSGQRKFIYFKMHHLSYIFIESASSYWLQEAIWKYLWISCNRSSC